MAIRVSRRRRRRTDCENPCFVGPNCNILSCKRGSKLQTSKREVCLCPPLFDGICCERPLCSSFGIAIRNGTECLCKTLRYYGPNCELTLCANGGRDNMKGSCSCEGLGGQFYGEFCEKIRCMNGGRQEIGMQESYCKCSMRLFKGHFCEEVDSGILTGILLGGLIPILAIFAYCCLWRRHKHNRRDSENSSEAESELSINRPMRMQNRSAPLALGTPESGPRAPPGTLTNEHYSRVHNRLVDPSRFNLVLPFLIAEDESDARIQMRIDEQNANNRQNTGNPTTSDESVGLLVAQEQPPLPSYEETTTTITENNDFPPPPYEEQQSVSTPM